MFLFFYILFKWKQALALLKLLWEELPREPRYWRKVDMRRFSWVHLKQFQRNGFRILMHVIYPHQLVQWWGFCMYPRPRLHILVTILSPINLKTKLNGAIIRYIFHTLIWEGKAIAWHELMKYYFPFLKKINLCMLLCLCTCVVCCQIHQAVVHEIVMMGRVISSRVTFLSVCIVKLKLKVLGWLTKFNCFKQGHGYNNTMSKVFLYLITEVHVICFFLYYWHVNFIMVHKGSVFAFGSTVVFFFLV